MTTPAAPQGAKKPAFTHPLKLVIESGRHPWVWADLDTSEADTLAGLLDAFVHYYNVGYVTDKSELIPGCWRGHPRLMHELPVLYWQWVTSHQHPAADLTACAEFYDKALPGFQGRLNALIGMAATMCRKGEHSTAASDNDVGPARSASDAVLRRESEDKNFLEYAINAFRM